LTCFNTIQYDMDSLIIRYWLIICLATLCSWLHAAARAWWCYVVADDSWHYGWCSPVDNRMDHVRGEDLSNSLLRV